jgi:predicted MFS family arabinose efflux permease
VLLLSMIGNALSMALWVCANSFSVFVLSRIVGGLTEGNVQMSIAMISDLTPPETRSKNLVFFLI